MAVRSKAKSQRSGRKDSTERIRELVALLGSLSRAGDSVTIDAISSRMGISSDEATSLMDIVCQASGEESGGLLISMNDEETAYTLQYTNVRGRPLRLTRAETVALIHALDIVGVEEDDPLRIRLSDAFGSPGIDEAQVRQALGAAWGDEWHAWHHTLQTCAQSQVDVRSISFLYQGMRDSTPRRRNANVLHLVSKESGWYVEAIDLDINEHRTFRVDNMSAVELGDYLDPQDEDGVYVEPQMVTLHFHDAQYLTMFEWPGLRIIQTRNGITTCRIPYYGNRSSWLPRRIVACGGSLVSDDEDLMQRASYYASDLL